MPLRRRGPPQVGVGSLPGVEEVLEVLGRLTGHDTATYKGYLAALADRRRYFIEVGGATSTDHGHPTARTADLPAEDAAALYARVRTGGASAKKKSGKTLNVYGVQSSGQVGVVGTSQASTKK